MRLLVTNDDGIECPGIHVLARELLGAGHEVVVAAPDRDWSGASSALGRIHLDEHIDATEVEVPGCPDAAGWAIGGPPGMCVLAGRLGAFGDPPELIVSGINAGLNTGRAILHSGTVGAALTAQNFGLSGLAVSVESTDPWYWDTAAVWAVRALELLIRAPGRSVLNLNVPGRPHDEVRGIRWAHLAPFGEVRAAVAEARDDRLQFRLQSTGDHDLDPDTDQGLVRSGYAALTTLVGVAEAWPAEEGLDSGDPVEVVDRVVAGAPVEAVHEVPDASHQRALRRPDIG